MKKGRMAEKHDPTNSHSHGQEGEEEDTDRQQQQRGGCSHQRNLV